MNPGRGLIEKNHTGLVHDCRAECNALFPPTGETACYLVFFAFESGERQHPLSLLFSLSSGYTVNPAEEIEVILDRKVLIGREVLLDRTDPLQNRGRPQA